MTEQDPLPLSACCCQNGQCLDYGKTGRGTLSQPSWVDRTTQRIRTLRCRACQREVSGRTGTPWDHAHVREEAALAVARHLAEGEGIRQTARLVGVDQHTVRRWNRLLGAHGQALQHERVRHARVREAPGDERWSFVGTKRRSLRPHRRRR